jgi:PAS domain S-box-containing protein
MTQNAFSLPRREQGVYRAQMTDEQRRQGKSGQVRTAQPFRARARATDSTPPPGPIIESEDAIDERSDVDRDSKPVILFWVVDLTTERELDALRREVARLRSRVADLERSSSRFDEASTTSTRGGLEVSISERESLLLEAERLGHIGSWFWNIETNQVVWSDELYRILGYDRECEPASVDAFFAAVHPDDRAWVQKTSSEAVPSGISPEISFRILRGDGSIRYVTMAGAMLYDESGTLRRIVGAISDRTEAYLVAERLREVNADLEEAQRLGNIGSWHFDATTQLVRWSSETARMLGIAGAESSSIDSLLELVEPDERRAIREHLQAFVAGREVPEFQCKIRRRDSACRTVRVRSATVTDASGQVVGVRGTMLDVSDLIEMQQKLIKVEKMQAVGRLAGGIAHEFNNLLTIISANLELMGSDFPDALRSAGDALKALGSARTLVSRLLAFGQRSPLARVAIHPNELIRGTLALLRPLLGDEIALRAELAEPLPLICVDTNQIEESLINLVARARENLGSGGEICIATRLDVGEEAPFIEILIRDNGAGIEESQQGRIFEPFFTTRHERDEGGLGLASVLGTAEQHGGNVSVRSAAGAGSEFRLRLPVYVPASNPVEPTVVDKNVETSTRRLTVFLIEDEPMIAKVLKRGLERRGHAVLVAQNASEARTIWASERAKIDVIVCDVVMPQVRGPELIAELGVGGSRPKVIFMTGYSREIVEQPLDFPVVLKPFSVDDLNRVIDRECASLEVTALVGTNRTASG